MNHFFRCLACLVVLVFSSIAFADLGKAEFASIQKAVKHVLAKYPPNEYAYIGLGTSPTPIIAYLQTEPGTLALNLPGTNFRIDPKARSFQNQVFENFQVFLPTGPRLESRSKILLMDLTLSGTSLVSAMTYVSAYYGKVNPEVQVFALGLGDGFFQRIKQESRSIPHILMDLLVLDPGGKITSKTVFRKDPFYLKMVARLYKDVAEYESYNLQGTAPPVSQTAYLEFRAEIERAKQTTAHLDDLWLDTFRTLFGYTMNQSIHVAPELEPWAEKYLDLQLQRFTKKVDLAEFLRRSNLLVDEAVAFRRGLFRCRL